MTVIPESGRAVGATKSIATRGIDGLGFIILERAGLDGRFFTKILSRWDLKMAENGAKGLN